MEEKDINKCNCSEDCTCGNECNCNDNCNCGDECKCTEEEKCSSDCTCGNECNCNDNCDCGDECTCGEIKENKDDCKCEKEKKKSLFSKKNNHKEKIEELENKIKELEDKNLRQSAEFANYKRRREEETSRMLKYSNEDIVKELLPIIDNFERAIGMDDENLEDEVSKFLSGFKMIYCNFNSILEHHGVTEIEALNKEFDPNIHQAVMTEARDGINPGIVIEVLQKGYRLKDKVIRPSMVKVSE